MIKSFKHDGLEKFVKDKSKAGINPLHAKRLKRITDLLEAAKEIRDMNYPSSYLHLLEPRQDGIWSVRVSGNWRVIFRFENGNAYDVDYLDYH